MALSAIGFVRRVSVFAASALLLLSATVYLAVAVTSGPVLPNPGNPKITKQQQIQLGYKAAQQVYQQMPVLPDNSPETLYVRQVGERLVKTIPQQYSWPFRFHVIPQKEINAFALPGGEMFVNIGTLTSADSEAELAGVMGHEMAHVYMQHSAKQMQKAQVTQGIAGIAGAILGARGGFVGGLGQMGVQMGAGMVLMKYSRGDESQADSVGAIVLYKAGYNPQGMADFFKKLEVQGGGSGPQFLNSHPNPGNRHDAIQKEIQGWPPVKYRTDNAAFEQTKQHALGVKAYTAQEIAQGAKQGQWVAMNKQNGAVLTPPAGMVPAGKQ